MSEENIRKREPRETREAREVREAREHNVSEGSKTGTKSYRLELATRLNNPHQGPT